MVQSDAVDIPTSRMRTDVHLQIACSLSNVHDKHSARRGACRKLSHSKPESIFELMKPYHFAYDVSLLSCVLLFCFILIKGLPSGKFPIPQDDSFSG